MFRAELSMNFNYIEQTEQQTRLLKRSFQINLTPFSCYMLHEQLSCNGHKS